MFFCFAVQLACNLDLLSSCEEEADRYSCHASHLCLIEQTHKFLHQSKRQVGIFNTIDSQSAPCVLILILKFIDYRVMHVFFLLAKEMSWHRVESVRTEFMFAQNNLHHVELDTAFYIDFFCVTCSKSFWTQGSRFDFAERIS